MAIVQQFGEYSGGELWDFGKITTAVLPKRELRDAAVNFDTYRSLQRHRTVSLPQRAFLVYMLYTRHRSNAEITQYADFHGREAKSRR